MTLTPPTRRSPALPASPSDALDLRLTRALEQPPVLRIPANFAARVAATAPARPATRVTAAHFGRKAFLAAIAALLVCMLAFAPAALRTATVPVALECSFAAEFVLLMVFMSLKPSILR